MVEKHLPVEHFNVQLREMGRSLDDAVHTSQHWRGDDFGLLVTWPDGHTAFVGFGPMATAVVEAHLARKH